MKSKLTDLTYSNLNRRTQRTRHVGVIATLTIVLLAALTATAWAAWGAARNGGGLSALLETHLTATPTRTPRPVTPRPTQIPVDLVIVAPTATPTPGTQPPGKVVTTTSASAITPEPLPDYLKRIVAEYGMDPARRFIVVDPGTQLMTIWDPASAATGGQSVRQMPVSTGDETRGYHTPAWYGLVGKYWGTFHAFGVYADEGWYLFEDGGSILIHGAPYKWINGQKVYQDLDALGNYPASRGCIRLSPDDAKWFTAWGPEGVPLVILPTPEDAGVG